MIGLELLQIMEKIRLKTEENWKRLKSNFVIFEIFEIFAFTNSFRAIFHNFQTLAKSTTKNNLTSKNNLKSNNNQHFLSFFLSFTSSYSLCLSIFPSFFLLSMYLFFSFFYRSVSFCFCLYVTLSLCVYLYVSACLPVYTMSLSVSVSLCLWYNSNNNIAHLITCHTFTSLKS